MSIRPSERGFILSYILVALVILVITVQGLRLITDGMDVQARTTDEAKEELLRQIGQIRATLQLCAVLFPAGNNGTGFHPSYPATPVSGQLRDAECPGVPNGNKNIWTSGQVGHLLPKIPMGFGEWQYINDADSIRITLDPVSAGDVVASTIVTRAQRRIGENASISGDTFVVKIIQ